MKSITKINYKHNDSLIKINDNIFSIGSCFSNEIFSYFKKNGIYIISNPFGTVYNIYSIYKILECCINNKKYNEKDLIKYNKKYFSFDHSTLFESEKKDDILKKINNKVKLTFDYINKCNLYIITLGTSVVYKYFKNNEIVANCHKMPHDNFFKEIFDVNHTQKIINNIIQLIHGFNTNSKIIFTISPVRHTPMDLVENSYSKSVLRAAVDSIINNQNIFYFPSYEIVIDELRNYEFYKKDMLHLKNKSVNYIMKIFNETFFNNNLKEFINKYSKYKKMIRHKVKNRESIKYYELLIKCLNILNELYEKRASDLLKNEQFIISKKILKNFSSKKEILTIFNETFKNNKIFLNIFQTAFKIKNDNEFKFDDKNFLDNSDSSIVKKFKKKILLEYYKNNKKYEKISKLLFF